MSDFDLVPEPPKTPPCPTCGGTGICKGKPAPDPNDREAFKNWARSEWFVVCPTCRQPRFLKSTPTPR